MAFPSLLPAPSEAAQPETAQQQVRIRFVSKVFRVVLVLFGAGAGIAQLIKLSPMGGITFALTDLIALLLGIGLIGLGRSPRWPSLIRAALHHQRPQARQWFFVLPWLLGLVVVGLKHFWGHTSSYKMMLTEGGFIEYGTMLAFLLVPLFALPLAQRFRHQQQTMLSAAYYLLAGGSFFVAMEEISWGQMLFNWQGSRFFVEHNSQAETNIHNLLWVNSYFTYAVLVMSLLASFACLGYWGLKRRGLWRSHAQLQFWLPEDTWLGFFGVTALIYGMILSTQGQGFFNSGDQEFAELILALGCLLATVTKYLKQA